MPGNVVTMARARAITLGVAVFALVLLLASGPGTKAGLWPWTTALGFFKYAAYCGIAAAVAALLLVVLLAVPRWRVRPWVPVLALCIALAALAPPMILLSKAKSLPLIHDVSTDVADPPAFVALLEARRQAPNGAAYGGPTVAAAQAQGYPDIKPILVKGAPREVMQRAIDAARALGWEVVASDATAGRIEATDTTAFFGFKDDIVVRIRAQGDASRVDVRSVSRVGLSDVGANAKRIREFRARLT